MPTRWVVLVVIELAAVVFLAMQLAAGPAPAVPQVPPAVDGPADHEVRRANAATSGDPASEQRTDAAPAPAAMRVEVKAKWNPDDPVGVILSGSVRWPDGRPVPACNLYLGQGRTSRSSESGSDGTFAIVGLQPGEWKLNVSADGAVRRSEPVVITDDAEQRLELTLQPSFPVKVMIVTADGSDGTMALRKQISGMRDLHVVGGAREFPARMAPTDSGILMVGDAQWDREMNPKEGFAGTLHLASAPPAYVALLLRHLVLEQQVVQPGQTEVRFVIDLARIGELCGSATLRVLDDATGEPLTTARVAFNTSGAHSVGTLVDENGRVTCTGLLPGLLTCTILAKDREQYQRKVLVEPGQLLQLGDVRVAALQSMSGRVFGPDGTPDKAASVNWTELKFRTGPTAFVHNRSTRVEADGTFKLWGTGPGPIAMTARGSDGRVAVGVFDNPPGGPVELRLADGCTCEITRPSDLTRSFTVTLYDDRRRAVAAMTLAPRLLQATMTMPAGSYPFEVHDDGARVVQTGTLTFGAAPTRLEIK